MCSLIRFLGVWVAWLLSEFPRPWWFTLDSDALDDRLEETIRDAPEAREDAGMTAAGEIAQKQRQKRLTGTESPTKETP